MSRYRERCMCGDPYCPSCGGAMGTYPPPPEEDEPEGEFRCKMCNTLLDLDFEGQKYCEDCQEEVDHEKRHRTPEA